MVRREECHAMVFYICFIMMLLVCNRCEKIEHHDVVAFGPPQRKNCDKRMCEYDDEDVRFCWCDNRKTECCFKDPTRCNNYFNNKKNNSCNNEY